MSDKELDNLFKEAAEGFKAPANPAAWQDMSNKLDQNGIGTSTFWNWKTISTMAIVGVLSVASVLYVLNRKPEFSNQPELTSNQPVGNADLKADQSSENKLAEENSSEDQNNNTVSKGTGKTNQENDHPEANQADQNKIEKINRTIKTSEINDSDVNKASTQYAKPKQNLSGSVQVVDVRVSENNDGTNGASVLQDQNKSEASRRLVENEISPAIQVAAIESNKSEKSLGNIGTENQAINQSAAESLKINNQYQRIAADTLIKEPEVQTEKPAENSVANSEKKKSDKKKLSSGPVLSIKLVGSPDYTSVKSSTPNGWGFSYGVLFEYQFSKHWSVATGGIWEKKIYTAYDVEYNGHSIDWVDGDCRMWDIPVNVYYKFTPSRPFSFYGGLGFSSYIMQEENYMFYVETQNGVYDYPKQIKGENNEWFKTLNISLGMQYRLNDRFALQLEPILKAPLTGVGEGEVSLISLGAFFNFRYDIPIHKRGANGE